MFQVYFFDLEHEYDLMGNHIVDDFDNVNPDNVNSELNNIEKIKTELVITVNEQGDLASVDTNGDGKVTISEAKRLVLKCLSNLTIGYIFTWMSVMEMVWLVNN